MFLLDCRYNLSYALENMEYVIIFGFLFCIVSSMPQQQHKQESLKTSQSGLEKQKKYSKSSIQEKIDHIAAAIQKKAYDTFKNNSDYIKDSKALNYSLSNATFLDIYFEKYYKPVIPKGLLDHPHVIIEKHKKIVKKIRKHKKIHENNVDIGSNDSNQTVQKNNDISNRDRNINQNNGGVNIRNIIGGYNVKVMIENPNTESSIKSQTWKSSIKNNVSSTKSQTSSTKLPKKNFINSMKSVISGIISQDENSNKSKKDKIKIVNAKQIENVNMKHGNEGKNEIELKNEKLNNIQRNSNHDNDNFDDDLLPAIVAREIQQSLMETPINNTQDILDLWNLLQSLNTEEEPNMLKSTEGQTSKNSQNIVSSTKSPTSNKKLQNQRIENSTKSVSRGVLSKDENNKNKINNKNKTVNKIKEENQIKKIMKIKNKSQSQNANEIMNKKLDNIQRNADHNPDDDLTPLVTRDTQETLKPEPENNFQNIVTLWKLFQALNNAGLKTKAPISISKDQDDINSKDKSWIRHWIQLLQAPKEGIGNNVVLLPISI